MQEEGIEGTILGRNCAIQPLARDGYDLPPNPGPENKRMHEAQTHAINTPFCIGQTDIRNLEIRPRNQVREPNGRVCDLG